MAHGSSAACTRVAAPNGADPLHLHLHSTVPDRSAYPLLFRVWVPGDIVTFCNDLAAAATLWLHHANTLQYLAGTSDASDQFVCSSAHRLAQNPLRSRPRAAACRN